ncbi:class I SAM-dependent methyltransferase [Planctomycetaceae bacterium SH139]
MKPIANWIMRRRAQGLLKILEPYLPAEGLAVDVGSGTGHNAEVLRRATSLRVCEFDVADIHWVGPGPTIMVDDKLPLHSDSVACVLILYVLHYCPEPAALLAEAARVSPNRVLVLQTTYKSPLAMQVLRVQEFFFGRFGYYMARIAGLVPAGTCPLQPTRYFNRDSLEFVFAKGGLRILERNTFSHPSWPLRCDLYQLRKG